MGRLFNDSLRTSHRITKRVVSVDRASYKECNDTRPAIQKLINSMIFIRKASKFQTAFWPVWIEALSTSVWLTAEWCRNLNRTGPNVVYDWDQTNLSWLLLQFNSCRRLISSKSFIISKFQYHISIPHKIPSKMIPRTDVVNTFAPKINSTKIMFCDTTTW